MKKALLREIACILALTLPFGASAQFHYGGTEPARIKWNSAESPAFKTIYPIWLDSLALEYSLELEKYRIPVGKSLGMTGGENHRKPVPVILHAGNMSANGEVVWAPKRMELRTLPEWSGASAMPWKTMLSIHEGRHYAQMQFGYRHVFKPFTRIFGEMFPGAMAGLFPGKLLLEGDAVVAETALSNAGRGRQSDFLLYYYLAFDSGDYRDWTRWRLGSYYRYTPDHYSFGYLMLGGIRTLYDKPLFMADYFDYVSRRPYDPWPLRHALRRASGKKFRESYKEIISSQHASWMHDALLRAPYVPYETISRPAKIPTGYSNPNVDIDGSWLWVKEDIYHNPALYRIDDKGREKRLFPVGNIIDKMNHEDADSVLVWSELRKDPRWSERVKTVIRTYNTHTGRRSTISHGDNYVYPIRLGEDFLVIDLGQDGHSRLLQFHNRDGNITKTHAVPYGLQPMEVSHIDSTLYVLGLSERGYGIYEVCPGKWKCVFDPIPVRMSSLEHDSDCLTFESDYNGSWEFYRFNPSSGVMTQLTSSRYGGCDYNLCDKGDVTWTVPAPEGSRAVRTPRSALLHKVVDPKKYYRHAMADKLSAQEKALGAVPQNQDTSIVNSPEGWYKFKGALNVHSWAPLYADINSIADISYENVKNMASLGAMAFFQSPLNSFGGYVGYKASPDATGKWWHSGHIDLKYSGLYPVFEAKVDFGERNAYSYFYNGKRDTLFVKKTDRILFRARMESYVPLSWSDEAALYGLVPRIGVGIRNDALEGKSIVNFYGGVRGYVMSRTPEGCIFPKWGVGAELMYCDPLAYCYAYGYVPSVLGQGLKLSALWQKAVNPSQIFLDTYAVLSPRGIDSRYRESLLEGMKFTADYAIPFPVGDFHIGTAFYCKRGILTPHFDLGLFKNGRLFSGGASLELEFGSFLWVRTPITIGVTYSRNGGSLLEKMPLQGKDNVGFLFNIELPG